MAKEDKKNTPPIYDTETGALTDYGKSLGLQPVQTVKIQGIEVLTLKGDPGHTPTDEELLALIKPLIPEVKNGENGQDGHTPTYDELLALIRPLIPKVENGETPSDEKLLSLIATLIPPHVLDPEGPEVTLDNIKEIKDEILILQKKIDELLQEKTIIGKGGVGLKGSINTSKSNQYRFMDDDPNVSGIINGINTDFIVSKTPVKRSMKIYRGGGREEISAGDFTLTSKLVRFIIAPQVGETLVFDYRY